MPVSLFKWYKLFPVMLLISAAARLATTLTSILALDLTLSKNLRYLARTLGERDKVLRIAHSMSRSVDLEEATNTLN